MRKTSITTLSLALSALVAASAIAPVAQAKRVRVQEKVWVCDHSKKKATNGTMIGAIGGGLVGNALGKDTGSTLIGAGVGAVAGHEIAKGSSKRNCHYETRWVYRNR